MIPDHLRSPQSKSLAMVRAGIARAVGGRQAIEYVAARWGADSDEARVLRSAIPAMGTTDGTATLAPKGQTDFADSMRYSGGFDYARQWMFQARMHAQTTFITQVVVGAEVSQAAAKPVRQFSVGISDGDPTKCIFLCVVDNDLLKFAPDLGERAISAAARPGMALASDIPYLAKLRAAEALSIQASGDTASALRTDLIDAAVPLRIGTGSKVFVFCSTPLYSIIPLLPASAADASPAFPDFPQVGRFEFVATDALEVDSSGGTLVLCDVSRVAYSDSGVSTRTSMQGTVQMSDTPDSPPTEETIVQSLWQLNRVGLLFERYLQFDVLGDDVVSTITGANYGS